ncbi:MAG: hypothetical protein GX810_02190, partial [Clostridiales bacterium]|nr:hypothetical protein [Clostridiales bacterium]
MQFQEEQDYSQSINLGVWKKLISYLKAFRGKLVFVGFMMAILAVVDVMMPLMSRYGI